MRGLGDRKGQAEARLSCPLVGRSVAAAEPSASAHQLTGGTWELSQFIGLLTATQE